MRKLNYNSILDVIVIGAGHAGLSISYLLKKLHLSHIVLEKGKIGDTWRNQRWDSFKLNTPNKVNSLPGQENIFTDAEGFCTASRVCILLGSYSGTSLPLFGLQLSEKIATNNTGMK
jgi:putative flavoprotein involved in K+ transport